MPQIPRRDAQEGAEQDALPGAQPMNSIRNSVVSMAQCAGHEL